MTAVDAEDGRAMHRLIAELFPLCRSITGEGVRETLRILGGQVPLEIHEVPSGTQVLDWTVPPEWTIRDAYVANDKGERVIDFRASSLHVVSYSRPVRASMTLGALRSHLHADPAHPDWIPYRTSYYKEDWGFCLSQRQLESLDEGRYEVVIDSDLAPGSLTYGECFVPGEGPGEVLISAHVCHPSLANDNLSGIAVATRLIRRRLGRRSRYGYRFVFAPGTIGAITWLARNEARLGAIRHGLVLANLGDPGPLHYKRSRQGDAAVDRAAALVLRDEPGSRVLDFEPYGYDERQYCSPGFDLPVGSLSRTPYGRFPEYHTSADDLDLVRPEALAHSLAVLEAVLDVLERDATYVNLSPKGEPMLGRRGLYAALSGQADARARQLALLWVLNLSDSRHSLIDITERSGLGFALIAEAAGLLEAHDLLATAA
jgi:aminopeptidase-like protein